MQNATTIIDVFGFLKNKTCTELTTEKESGLCTNTYTTHSYIV